MQHQTRTQLPFLVQTNKYNLQHNNTNKNMKGVPHIVRHKIINDSLMFLTYLWQRTVIKCKLKFTISNFNKIWECFMGHIEKSIYNLMQQEGLFLIIAKNRNWELLVETAHTEFQQYLCNDFCDTWMSPIMASSKLGFIVDRHTCTSNFHTTFGANLPLRISTTCTKRFMGYCKSIHVWSYIKLEFNNN